MSPPIISVSPALTALIERAVARVRHAVPADQPWPGDDVDRRLEQVALASEFALDTLARQPALLQHLAQPDPPPLPLPVLDPAQPQAWPAQLRRYRSAESTRLVWRDVLDLDSVDATLAGATRLAETCLQCGLQALEQQFRDRHGQVIAEDGSVQ
ncbi:MAG: glutamine-synthetase adenylyltransferase, partial [Oxalobacteraceae bacterium]